MRIITFITIFVITINFTANSQQSCLPGVTVFNNQISLDNFQTNYPGCTKIEGDIIIEGSDITSLAGLLDVTEIGGYLEINNNTNLSSFSGLNNIESIGMKLSIKKNPILTDITALSLLDSVHDDLYIETNEQLVSLEGLHNIKHVEGFVDILVQHRIKNLSGLRSLETVGEFVYLAKMDSIVNYSGLGELRQTGGLSASRCPQFEDFSGMPYLEKLGQLVSQRNDNLSSFNGLSGIDSIELLTVSNSEKLIDFSGLENIKYIGGTLMIGNNDNLINFHGLDSIVTIEGQIRITDHPELLSLHGLDNVDAMELDKVEIFDNPKLSLCEVQSICDYIARPDASAFIHGNAQNCNSLEEVETACIYASLSELTFNDLFNIYPNPTSNRINIENYNGANIDELMLYNQYGQKVIHNTNNCSTVELNGLNPGLYIVEITSNRNKFRAKIIVK